MQGCSPEGLGEWLQMHQYSQEELAVGQEGLHVWRRPETNPTFTPRHPPPRHARKQSEARVTELHDEAARTGSFPQTHSQPASPVAFQGRLALLELLGRGRSPQTSTPASSGVRVTMASTACTVSCSSSQMACGAGGRGERGWARGVRRGLKMQMQRWLWATAVACRRPAALLPQDPSPAHPSR